MRLTSLDKVKEFLGLTDTSQDSLLGTLLDGVSDAIETDCRRAIALGTYSEKLDILEDYTEDFMVANYPVRSVVALTDNGTLMVDVTNYYWETQGYFHRYPEDYYWTTGLRKVEITYTAGYATIPDDIQLLAQKLVAQVYNSLGTGGFESERIGDYSYRVLTDMILSDAFLNSVLKRYRKVW